MERDSNRAHSESLVRKITNERERFVSAWQEGAGSIELNEIRENIKELNDLLWETTLQEGHPDPSRYGFGSHRDSNNRGTHGRNQP